MREVHNQGTYPQWENGNRDPFLGERQRQTIFACLGKRIQAPTTLRLCAELGHIDAVKREVLHICLRLVGQIFVGAREDFAEAKLGIYCRPLGTALLVPQHECDTFPIARVMVVDLAFDSLRGHHEATRQ